MVNRSVDKRWWCIDNDCIEFILLFSLLLLCSIDEMICCAWGRECNNDIITEKRCQCCCCSHNCWNMLSRMHLTPEYTFYENKSNKYNELLCDIRKCVGRQYFWSIWFLFLSLRSVLPPGPSAPFPYSKTATKQSYSSIMKSTSRTFRGEESYHMRHRKLSGRTSTTMYFSSFFLPTFLFLSFFIRRFRAHITCFQFTMNLYLHLIGYRVSLRIADTSVCCRRHLALRHFQLNGYVSHSFARLSLLLAIALSIYANALFYILL